MSTGNRTVGRPLQHMTVEEKKAASALAARQYRARQKAVREKRLSLSKQPKSKVIDLSTLTPPWRA